ncbi:MAG: vWA domain-containing protein [Myxococcota bacterium]
MRFQLIGLTIFFCYACADYPFQFQQNSRNAGRGYRIEVGVSEQTDILFIVDNSGSMAEEQAELRANVDAFIRVLTESPNDYQVGLISTDISRAPPDDISICEPCCDIDTDSDGIPDFTDCDDGRLYSSDFQNRIFSRPPREGRTAEEIAQDTDALIREFNATIEVLGTDGSAFEAPLEAMKRAVDPQGDVAVRLLNRGFLREDASLAVIFLTDEDDCSFPESFYEGRFDDISCYVEDGALPINDYVDFLVQLKGSVEAVRAAAIVGGVPIPDADERELGFRASGCVTDQADAVGEPSDACGCWTSRFVIDPRDTTPCDGNALDDYFCNYLSEPPFAQSCERLPIDGSGQGGCIALPGSRIVEFLDEIRERRLAANLTPGVIADSICRADYRQTLENIASSVVLDRCFGLEEVPPDLGAVQLLRNGETLERVTDQESPTGWFYDVERNEICLAGQQTRRVGDIFEIAVLLEQRGTDEEE